MDHLTDTSHRRFNPLLRSWVLCSPHRTKRPWQGSTELPALESRPRYDDACYLCPGNTRAGGKATPLYDGCYVFENDFAALLPPEEVEATPASGKEEDELFQLQSAQGICHVICFSPRHDLTVAEMSDGEILGVIKTWTKVYKDVSQTYGWIKYVQIFENKGSIMGCSNPHPHGQVWSSSFIPTNPLSVLNSQKDHHLSHPSSDPFESHLLLSYVAKELSIPRTSDTSRVVFITEHWVVLVPFWAGWPFETLILPRLKRIPSLAHLTGEESAELSSVIGRITRRMDNLFQCSFGYSMGIYQSPTYHPNGDPDEWDRFAQFHIGFYPPLLRSSSVKKFLVGYEMFAETQRDITPEQAAKRLRECSEVHYKARL